jgi:hypothetical protein
VTLPKEVRRITVQHAGTCLSCEETVRVGDDAYWLPGIGVWHVDCPEPRNLKLYAREARDKPRLGT